MARGMKEFRLFKQYRSKGGKKSLSEFIYGRKK